MFWGSPARGQGKFWEMHERVLIAKTHAPSVERDVESGKASGVRGTPSLFINGAMYPGPRDRATLVAALARAARTPAVP